MPVKNKFKENKIILMKKGVIFKATLPSPKN